MSFLFPAFIYNHSKLTYLLNNPYGEHHLHKFMYHKNYANLEVETTMQIFFHLYLRYKNVSITSLCNVFDYFVGLGLNGLKSHLSSKQLPKDDTVRSNLQKSKFISGRQIIYSCYMLQTSINGRTRMPQ